MKLKNLTEHDSRFFYYFYLNFPHSEKQLGLYRKGRITKHLIKFILLHVSFW